MPVSISPAEAEAVQNAMAQAESTSPVVQDPTAAANSTIEAPDQASHDYSADETPGHIQADTPEIGEHDARVVEATKAGGRHVKQHHAQKADGQKQKSNKDREAHVEAKRKETEKSWKSNRRSVAPNHRGK